MELTPQILEKDGEKQFVVLPYEQFVELQEALEDLEDLKSLGAAKDAERDEPTVSLTDVEKERGRTDTPKKSLDLLPRAEGITLGVKIEPGDLARIAQSRRRRERFTNVEIGWQESGRAQRRWLTQ